MFLFGIAHSLSAFDAVDDDVEVEEEDAVEAELLALLQPTVLTSPRRPMILNNLVHVCIRRSCSTSRAVGNR
jgi:hypothetical protein